jgi:hypothetical protein
LTSNDDLESISARGGGANSDSNEDSEDEVAIVAAAAEDSDEDNSSAMRTFIAARLDVCDCVAKRNVGMREKRERGSEPPDSNSNSFPTRYQWEWE